MVARMANRNTSAVYAVYAICCSIIYGILIVYLFAPEFVAVLHSALPWSRKDTNGTSTASLIRPFAERPDVELALFWIRRTHAVGVREWFHPLGPDKFTYPTLHKNAATALTQEMVDNGRVVMPLHAVYLYLLSSCVILVFPEATAEVLHHDPSCGRSGEGDINGFMRSAAAVSAFIVMACGVPLAWRLMDTIVALILGAVKGREEVALAAYDSAASARTDPSFSSSAKGTTTTSSFDEEKGKSDLLRIASLSKLSSAAYETLGLRLTFAGAMTVQCLALVPAFALEVSTLHPTCLSTVLVLCALYGVLTDEMLLHGAPAEGKSEFDLSKAIVTQGNIFFYGLKSIPTLAYATVAQVCITTASLLHVPFLYLVPLFCIWGLTTCHQRSNRRVLVRVRVEECDRANLSAEDTLDENGYVRVGFSSYMDRTYLYECFARMFCAPVMTVIAVTTPMWVGTQPLLHFMSIFGRPSIPAFDMDGPISTSIAQPLHSGPRPVSLTGAGELRPECLSRPFSTYTCTRPAPNMWLLTEYYGVSWTSAVTNFAQLIINRPSEILSEAQMWLDYLSIVALVASHAVVLMVLLVYRIRKPPLNFETPSQFLTIRDREQAKYEAYERKRLAKRNAATEAAKQQKSGSDNNNNKKKKIAATDAGKQAAQEEKKKSTKPVRATCVSLEEYILKQITVLLWMTLISTVSCCVFLVHNSTLSFIPIAAPAAVLSAVGGVVQSVRRTTPLSFISGLSAVLRRLRSSSSAAASPQPQRTLTGGAAEIEEGEEEEQGISFWCSDSVAVVVEGADGIWLRGVAFAFALILTGAVFASPSLAIDALPRQVLLTVMLVSVVVECFTSCCWTRMDLATVGLAALLQGAGFYATYCSMDVMTGASIRADARAAAFSNNSFVDASASIAMMPDVARMKLAGASWLKGFTAVLARGFSDVAFDILVYEHTIAGLILLGSLVHASLRAGRLALGEEEVKFVSPEEEFGYYG